MKRKSTEDSKIPRREFLKSSGASVGAVGAIASESALAEQSRPVRQPVAASTRRPYNSDYSGEYLSRVAFPLGGIGGGMICLEGTGALSHFSLRNKPEVFNEPCAFAAISIKGEKGVARVLEGPVPSWKIFGAPGTGNGAGGTSFGLPRFSSATFRVRFPFATVSLTDHSCPLIVEITAWSPFEPGAADDSCLPVAALEYSFTNRSGEPQEAVFSFNARNFMPAGRNAQAVRPIPGGFVLWGAGAPDRPHEEGAFSATVSDPEGKVNHAWFRGGWFDALTMAWKDVEVGACYDRPPITEGDPAPGATLFVPFRIEKGASRTVVLRLAWYAGRTNLRLGKDPADSVVATSQSGETYRPWYTGRFADIREVTGYWRDHYAELKSKSERFSKCFYDSTLPQEVVEAVAANLTILKSPTVLRQVDGRLWAWEGCSDSAGCCHGTCTHVWNYAQAIPHLFPSLERSLRETEFGPSQNAAGHQAFRSSLPIRIVEHDFYAAADGQLGGIMKVYRDWRISGDTEWLRRLWPKVKQSMDYCIETWDPQHKGVVEEPHHNTYDIEFWGPDGMCTSFYLGALQAAGAMAKALGDDVPLYTELLEKGKTLAETVLFNGEYFIQHIEWKNLRAKNPLENKSMVGSYSPEAVALFEKEGPKYQYGNGCLSDGVLGSWLALVCGVGQVLDRKKVVDHLKAVHRYNLKKDLSGYANPQRPSYACGTEGGLLLCTWPKGAALSLPFVYSNEVWTGIEYQVSAHLMLMGMVQEGLEIVRTCRSRYDGRVRNPFNEYECGHWYARAMSSYALLQGLTGARYDAVEKVLYLEPSIKGDYRSFLATATGYGTVGVKDGKPFFDLVAGQVDIKEFRYRSKV
ncbi:MAG TPA: GH116 family glycosyl hydrolase [Acidobacteriota bacterium]|nr:GH116 family glycosyl hydrolase [Acidobacteriota bacterium]